MVMIMILTPRTTTLVRAQSASLKALTIFLFALRLRALARLKSLLILQSLLVKYLQNLLSLLVAFNIFTVVTIARLVASHTGLQAVTVGFQALALLTVARDHRFFCSLLL